jgi:hypothetical protein
MVCASATAEVVGRQTLLLKTAPEPSQIRVESGRPSQPAPPPDLRINGKSGLKSNVAAKNLRNPLFLWIMRAP